jgi:hypothetical protein
MPVFAYHAIQDWQTTIEPMDDLVNRLCRVGVNIHYQRNTVGLHLEESITGNPRALSWLQQVLDGTKPEPLFGCKIEDVTIQ